MLKQQISVGDLVEYHGSQTLAHGDYVVALVPEDPDGRGYNLVEGKRVWNVHRDSITLKMANYKVGE